jgi:hypothetical protein
MLEKQGSLREENANLLTEIQSLQVWRHSGLLSPYAFFDFFNISIFPWTRVNARLPSSYGFASVSKI